ncbi:glycoside hydrolase family 12 protein [Panaeolus papilionaceus]|nr:glycoside hydrolase family 12 protein [Panaeolus papilionaceus]
MVILKSLSTFLIMGLLGSSVATPAPATQELVKRGRLLTGKYDSEAVPGGRFLVKNNLWGMEKATSGWQNTQVTGTNNDAVIWYTTYSWKGAPYEVKSYACLDLIAGMNKRIQNIGWISTIFNWRYGSASGDLVANVAYDLWLSHTPGTQGATGTTTYEIMIWLSSRGGAQPIGNRVGNANINGINWAVWRGTVQNWAVISFVPPYEIRNFSQDLKPYLNYLVNNQGVPASQYLVQAQAGTEPFVGTATVNVDWFTMSVN